MDKERLLTFSDGVFAILITILVLDFKLPAFPTGELAHALMMQWTTLSAYLLSFFYIGTLWLFHHAYLSTLKKTNHGVNIINLIMLFFITLIDYPTSVLSHTLQTKNPADLCVAVILYSAVMLLVSLLFFVLYLYVGRHPELKQETARTHFQGDVSFDPVFSVIIYSISVILASFNVWISLFFLVAGVLFHFLAYMKMKKRFQQYWDVNTL